MTVLEMEEHCIDILLNYQENNHLSQKELAQKLNLSENTLGRMLSRKTHVLGDSLSLMQSLFKLTGKMSFDLAGVDVSYSPRLALIKQISHLPEEYILPFQKVVDNMLETETTSMNNDTTLIQEAMDLQLTQYLKILKLNLTQDSYQVALVRPDEWEERKAVASNSKISSWFTDFANSDYMNPDDYEDFRIFTNLKNLRTHIRHTSNLRFKYHRKVDNVLNEVVMDIIRIDDPSTSDLLAMLYIRIAETMYE